MSKANKVWLKYPSDDFGYWTTEVSSEEVCQTQYEDFKNAVPFIELTPEVQRKLELFDELVEALDLVFFAYNQGCQLTEPEKIYDLLSRAKGEV